MYHHKDKVVVVEEEEEQEEYKSFSSSTTASTANDEDDDGDEDEDEEEDESKNMYGGRIGSSRERWMEHYSSSHRILLVGEGDFSFSLSLAKAFSSARNMVSTSIDSQQDLLKKYSNGLANVRDLEEMGCVVLYGVDAAKMSQHFFLSTHRFHRIVYNFPHVGFLFPEANGCQIKRKNEALEKNIALEKELREIRTAISKLESNIPKECWCSGRKNF